MWHTYFVLLPPGIFDATLLGPPAVPAVALLMGVRICYLSAVPKSHGIRHVPSVSEEGGNLYFRRRRRPSPAATLYRSLAALVCGLCSLSQYTPLPGRLPRSLQCVVSRRLPGSVVVQLPHKRVGGWWLGMHPAVRPQRKPRRDPPPSDTLFALSFISGWTPCVK